MRIRLVILLTILIVFTAACGQEGPTREELMAENETMLDLLAENEAKIQSLEETLKALSSDGNIKTAISSMSDGSGKLTFNTINNKIIFKVPFEYTGATQAPNTARLNITQNVSVAPSNNWLIKVDGTSSQFNHPNGITGEIKVGQIESAIKVDELQDKVFKPFISKVPNDGVTYGQIFLENTFRGYNADIVTEIDGNPAILKIGALGIKNSSVIYMFLYEGERDITKDELIDALIKTMKINNQQISYN